MEKKVPQRVVEDLDAFKAFLATQPLCRWAAEKEREIASGKHSGGKRGSASSAAKNDNDELAAALASMV